MHMPHALVMAMPGMTSSSRRMRRYHSASRVRSGTAAFQPAGRRTPERPGSGFPGLQTPGRHAAFATFGRTVSTASDPANRHQRNDRMAGSRMHTRLPAIGGAPGNRHLTGSRR